MKRKMLLWLLGAIVFTAASVNVGMNLLKHTPERDLMLANVEALAKDEVMGIALKPGTCGWGWHTPQNEEVKQCSISLRCAYTLYYYLGGNWCCDHCYETWYCGSGS